MNNIIEYTKNIIKGKQPLPDEHIFKNMIAELKAKFEYGLARKLLTLAIKKAPQNILIIQQLALCTYKDDELLPRKRFQEALKLLEDIGLLNPEDAINRKGISPDTISETLSLGGAIYKKMWEYGGQLEHLHQALAFYRSAWERDPKQDLGYGGVNAAYILDLLASRCMTIAVRSGIRPSQADEANNLSEKALKLRIEILQKLPVFYNEIKSSGKYNPFENYYCMVTLAEIYFGLKNYEKAGEYLKIAKECQPKEWECQTTFKQLVLLARLHGFLPPREKLQVEDWEPPWQALYQFLGQDTEKALSCYRGKVGLALSGGGFRASLFHIGVLARLAEMDVLRYIEVLSTVSGGSILGAHYYLEVQEFLEKKTDNEITRDDYIEIIKRLELRFLEGVQQNLRTKAFADIRANLQMIFSKEYSRSHRLGELYEEILYKKIGENGNRNQPRTMPELLITPAEHTSEVSFNPKFFNWRRRSKVPVLLLNATSLNSGHNWHFTGRWMGEPPSAISTNVDVNERYRRLWYEQAPKTNHRNYRLGYAVSASACVPGLFEPLTLEGLYPGRTVRLVDGGVHDNQGTEGLLNEGCTLILCSDASGQMEDQKNPSNNMLGVPLRSNSILMDRVREAQLQDLSARVDSHSLQGLFFIHLKKELQTLPIDWIDCEDPTIAPLTSVCTTNYGVDKDIQRKLANIRTDLDSFSEVEAYSLMLSGYLMTEHEFKNLNNQYIQEGEIGSWGDFNIYASREDWTFLQLENLLRQPPDTSDARRDEIGKQLDVGASRVFKSWKLSPVLRIAGICFIIGMFLSLTFLIYSYSGKTIQSPSMSAGKLFLLFSILLIGILFPSLKWLFPQRASNTYLRKIFIALAGWLISNIHLRTFDRIFLTYGKLERLLKLK